MLYSSSRDIADSSTSGALAGSATWTYETKRQNIQGFVEHYDEDFRMDTAFYNRVGITSGWAYTDWNFYPDKRFKWVKRITPFVYSQDRPRPESARG